MSFTDKTLLNQSLFRQIPERKFDIILSKFYSVKHKPCLWITKSLSRRSLPTRAPADRATQGQRALFDWMLTEWETCAILMKYSKHHNVSYIFNPQQGSTVEDTASFMASKWSTREFLYKLRMSAGGRRSLGLVSWVEVSYWCCAWRMEESQVI